jgi:hypothetical protein
MQLMISCCDTKYRNYKFAYLGQHVARVSVRLPRTTEEEHA